MKTFTVLAVLIAAGMFWFFTTASNQGPDLKTGSCGHDNIKIYYRITADYLNGCEGVARAKRFFVRFGFSVDTPITIYFRKRVGLDSSITELPGKQIYGYCDPQTMSIYISSLVSPFVMSPNKVYLRISYSPSTQPELSKQPRALAEFHRSVVTHEIAHLLAQHNFNLRSAGVAQDYKKMGHAVQEYIAAIVQLSTMESTLRRRILRQYRPQLIFDHNDQINIVLFACNPEIFTIMAYRHFLRKNEVEQELMLDSILSNDFNPDHILDVDL